MQIVAAHTSTSSLDRLTHEYGLKDELDGAWAVPPLALVRNYLPTFGWLHSAEPAAGVI
jgi:hypothetical protein